MKKIVKIKEKVLKNILTESVNKLKLDKKIAKQLIEKEIAEYLKGGKYEGVFPMRWIPSGLAVIEEHFTEKNGMVNSTMKIVKHKVYEAFDNRINELYTPEGKKATSPSNLKVLERLLNS